MINPELHVDRHRIIPSNIGKEELIQYLVRSGLSLQNWIPGSTKTIDHLLMEVNEGESQIIVKDSGEIQRYIRVVSIDVFYLAPNGDVYMLREDRQVLKGGEVKRRGYPVGVGEKMKGNEEPLDAVNRAHREELGIEEIAALYDMGVEDKSHESSSYPGLDTRLYTHSFVSLLSDESFRPEGYIEYQTDKTNYYVWDLVHSEAGRSLNY